MDGDALVVLLVVEQLGRVFRANVVVLLPMLLVTVVAIVSVGSDTGLLAPAHNIGEDVGVRPLLVDIGMLS